MAIAFQAASVGNITQSGQTATVTHTASGSNRAVIVMVVGGCGPNNEQPWGNGASEGLTCTYGGQVMTLLGHIGANNGTFAGVAFFGLLNPPTGVQTVSFSKASITWSLRAAAISYTGVASFGTTAAATGPLASTPMAMNVNSAAGEVVAHAWVTLLGSISNYTATGGGPRQIVNANDSGGGAYAVFGDAPGAATVTFAATRTTAGDQFAGAAIRMLPAAGGEPENPGELTTFSTPGAYTYNIPTWATHVDVVAIGGGGGGAGGANIGNGDGQGGKAGTWQSLTLKRGVDIPAGVTQITGAVGTGGNAGGSGNGSGTAGNPSTALASGLNLSAAGGGGGSGINSAGGNLTYGQSPGNLTFNGQVYTGGARAGASNNPSGTGVAGNPPGGGGEGGGGALFGTGSSGGPGGAGRVFFYAYRVPVDYDGQASLAVAVSTEASATLRAVAQAVLAVDVVSPAAVSHGQAIEASLSVSADPDDVARYDALLNTDLFLDVAFTASGMKTLNGIAVLSLSADTWADVTEFSVADAALPVVAELSADMSQLQGISGLLAVDVSPTGEMSQGQDVGADLEAIVSPTAAALYEGAVRANLVVNATFVAVGERDAPVDAVLPVVVVGTAEVSSGPVAGSGLAVVVTTTAAMRRTQYVKADLSVSALTDGELSASFGIDAVLELAANASVYFGSVREIVVVPFHDRHAVVPENPRLVEVKGELRLIKADGDYRLVGVNEVERVAVVGDSDRSVVVAAADRWVQVAPVPKTAAVS
ncbi:minor tail protein [Mycobacterium phage Gardann]|uniref:minor tail protein n=1 Tax=Mycobacterium phage Gardann TaxID=1873696 RepID=UPI000810FDB2|nr:minor tail protein [Mycobacterium phage Gardann]ANU79145.1 minor tail protein [Mycobacterium phage Gardann]ASR87408.1 minor tail protein [Mycobacterium phage Nicholasp3]